MKKKLLIKPSIAWIMIFSIFSAAAEAQNMKEIEKLAGHYCTIGANEQAESLFHRIVCFGNEQQHSNALKQLGDLYLKTGDLNQSVHYYQKALDSNPSDADLFFSYCFALIKNKQYDIALTELDAFQHKKAYREQYLLYFGLSHFLNENRVEAQIYLDSLATWICPEIKGEIDSLFNTFKHKNTKVAQVLSAVIPGSGQVYSGDLANGGKSFLLNGTLMTLTAYIAVKYGAAQSLLTFFPWFMRYYTSNIQNAAKLAEEKNLKYRSKNFERILLLMNECNSIKKK